MYSRRSLSAALLGAALMSVCVPVIFFTYIELMLRMFADRAYARSSDLLCAIMSKYPPSVHAAIREVVAEVPRMSDLLGAATSAGIVKSDWEKAMFASAKPNTGSMVKKSLVAVGILFGCLVLAALLVSPPGTLTSFSGFFAVAGPAAMNAVWFAASEILMMTMFAFCYIPDERSIPQGTIEGILFAWCRLEGGSCSA